MEPHGISPKYKKADFPLPLSFDHKVEVFRDRIEGWQLGIARQCLQIPHAGFGSLYICLSYFEMIGRYRAGSISIKGAGLFFKQGFQHFAVARPIASHPHFSTITDLLYEGARCGLYHISTTAHRVYLEYAAQSFEERVEREKRELAETEKNCKELEAKIGEPFEHEAKLQSLVKREKELEEALDITKNQAAASLAAEETEIQTEQESESESIQNEMQQSPVETQKVKASAKMPVAMVH